MASWRFDLVVTRLPSPAPGGRLRHKKSRTLAASVPGSGISPGPIVKWLGCFQGAPALSTRNPAFRPPPQASTCCRAGGQALRQRHAGLPGGAAQSPNPMFAPPRSASPHAPVHQPAWRGEGGSSQRSGAPRGDPQVSCLSASGTVHGPWMITACVAPKRHQRSGRAASCTNTAPSSAASSCGTGPISSTATRSGSSQGERRAWLEPSTRGTVKTLAAQSCACRADEVTTRHGRR